MHGRAGRQRLVSSQRQRCRRSFSKVLLFGPLGVCNCWVASLFLPPRFLFRGTQYVMATEVKQTYFSWSQGESTERDGPQGVSVSQTLDHGSISFGRFELESLSWEKWSVFTNDRRNEEFGKFNGLVAQKKAYFEEYYKKIRELKASQQQNQQTELILEYSGDGSDSSQTAEEEQGADLETPTGSGAAVDVYVEEVPCETTSEHGLQCYNDQGNENFDTEFSSSNLSSSGGFLQQTDHDVRVPVRGDNSTSKLYAAPQNASSVHDGTRKTYEAARTPRRIIEKDSRLRHSPKIIPKSVKALSQSAMDYTFTSERPGSVKPNTTTSQKAKPVQRPNAASQKMSASTERSKLTGLRRPSSAGAQRPSTGERHAIARENSQLPVVVSTPRRPSTAERRPVTRDRAEKQANVTTPRRPSTSERLPIKRETAAKHNDISAVRRPSTGERRAFTRDGVLRTDVKTPSKARATVAHPMSEMTTVGNTRKAITPNAARSSKLETKSNNYRLKGPSALDSHSTRSNRMDLQVSGKQKSSSVNLPPRKIFSSTAGEPSVGTISRSKKKEFKAPGQKGRSGDSAISSIHFKENNSFADWKLKGEGSKSTSTATSTTSAITNDYQTKCRCLIDWRKKAKVCSS
ncbi:TPX2 (targeting protein for Xklp2) protein family [Zea mays]|uniref:TPX2 (Targeting protein for Xklp2) protein family n=1 Tax=Zea mays TaxID=4577 RepID=A0A1D6N5C9_MAIZE|nr:TPX2 (targeting protein for Xklp2) protein family [Zea mays]